MSKNSFENIALMDDMDRLKGVDFHSFPITAGSTFIYESMEKAQKVFKGEEDAYIYSRWDNPMITMVEDKISKLESLDLDQSASTLLFSSGMAAINAVFQSVLKTGSTVLAQENVYGGSVELLLTLAEQLDLKLIFFDAENLDEFHRLIKSNPETALVYVESPSNPNIALIDIEAMASICKLSQAKLAVDATLASPYLLRPLTLGADFAIHSSTKYLNGHSSGLGGALTGIDVEFMKAKAWNIRKLHGAVCSPFEAWLINNGIKTLALRMDRVSNSALFIAKKLKEHPRVKKVLHPQLDDNVNRQMIERQMPLGCGGVLSFELEDHDTAYSAMTKIKHCRLTASLGSPDTLIQHPASMSHVNVPIEQRKKAKITDGLIRLSVGLENPEFIWSDIEQAIE